MWFSGEAQVKDILSAAVEDEERQATPTVPGDCGQTVFTLNFSLTFQGGLRSEVLYISS